jgi:hypothetical protein
MRTKTLFLILLGCVLTHFSFAQPVIQWEKSIGGSGADFAKSICMISDSSGYYVSGYTNSSDGDITEILSGQSFTAAATTT